MLARSAGSRSAATCYISGAARGTNMTTEDDRDIESSNPPSSFEVGEADRLSGFFTPVWESKRRLRAESPVPATSAAAAAPISSRAGAERATPTPPPMIQARAIISPRPAAPESTPAPKVVIQEALQQSEPLDTMPD